jgi:hypothetical protein
VITVRIIKHGFGGRGEADDEAREGAERGDSTDRVQPLFFHGPSESGPQQGPLLLTRK